MGYSSSNYGTYQNRLYDLKNTNKFQYLGISIINRLNKSFFVSILVRTEYSLPWWAILLIIVGVIIFIIITALILRTEQGRAFCACLLILCICCGGNSRRY